MSIRNTRNPACSSGGICSAHIPLSDASEWVRQATGHLIANGDLSSVLFFGSLGALALGGTVLIDRKKQLALGSNWPRLTQVTSNLPFAALLTGRTKLRWSDIGLLRIAAGLLLYAVLYLAHPIITGLPVMVPS